MKEQEILEYNKRCAEFMGLKRGWWNYQEKPLTEDKKQWLDIDGKTFLGTSVYCDKDLQFHSDWNWIMEVVEKIEVNFPKYTLEWEYDDREEFSEEGKYKAYWFTLMPKDEICKELSDLRSQSRKEAVIQAINKFLIWYNKNK